MRANKNHTRTGKRKTNKKQLAAAIPNAAENITLAQIIHNSSKLHTHTLSRTHGLNLQSAYRELIFALADNTLLNRIVLHCELHDTPPTPKDVQGMAAQIYKDYIDPPAWNWSSRLCNNLRKNSLNDREQITAILTALGLHEYNDLHATQYPLPETAAPTYTPPTPEPVDTTYNIPRPSFKQQNTSAL